MKAIAHYSFAIVAALGILTSCSNFRPEGARLSYAQAISLAKQAAEHDGRHLADYKSPEASYKEKDKTWFVFFDGKVPMPGNHFAVWVDDQTQKTEVVGGM